MEFHKDFFGSKGLGPGGQDFAAVGYGPDHPARDDSSEPGPDRAGPDGRRGDRTTGHRGAGNRIRRRPGRHLARTRNGVVLLDCYPWLGGRRCHQQRKVAVVVPS